MLLYHNISEYLLPPNMHTLYQSENQYYLLECCNFIVYVCKLKMKGKTPGEWDIKKKKMKKPKGRKCNQCIAKKLKIRIQKLRID